MPITTSNFVCRQEPDMYDGSLYRGALPDDIEVPHVWEICLETQLEEETRKDREKCGKLALCLSQAVGGLQGRAIARSPQRTQVRTTVFAV